MRESMFALVHKGDNPKSNLSIENDVWIGEGVTILGKVLNIGVGVVIDACSVCD